MKRYFLSALASLTLLLNACKKDAPDFTGYDSNGTVITTPQTGGGQLDTYLPASKGTYWKYQVTTGAKTDTNVITLTGNKTIIAGKTYLDATSKQTGMDEQPGYFYAGNHIYTLTATAAGITLEFLYLNDTTAVGNSWTANLTTDGKVNGVPARLKGKIIEKDISRTVLAKSFNNVMHTQINIEYDFLDGRGFQNYGTYDYYIAKGIGLIETDSEVIGITTTSKIFDYAIK